MVVPLPVIAGALVLLVFAVLVAIVLLGALRRAERDLGALRTTIDGYRAELGFKPFWPQAADAGVDELGRFLLSSGTASRGGEQA
jgi:hypothetical protein